MKAGSGFISHRSFIAPVDMHWQKSSQKTLPLFGFPLRASEHSHTEWGYANIKD
jgi:hypothetical protein